MNVPHLLFAAAMLIGCAAGVSAQTAAVPAFADRPADPAVKVDPAKISAADFLHLVRNPPRRDTWAGMKGTITHKRSGSRTVSAPLRLGILFTPARTVAQIVLDSKEIYDLSQTYGDSPVTSQHLTLPPDAGEPRLAVFGVQPDDLTMGFVYGELIAEDAASSIKGQSCRVFRLKSPDGKSWNRVYFSTEYLFPLKVEFYTVPYTPSAVHSRVLEISGFRKENDFWVVSALNLFGSNWRSKIEFPEVNAGETAKSVPRDLFIRAK